MHGPLPAAELRPLPLAEGWLSWLGLSSGHQLGISAQRFEKWWCEVTGIKMKRLLALLLLIILVTIPLPAEKWALLVPAAKLLKWTNRFIDTGDKRSAEEIPFPPRPNL